MTDSVALATRARSQGMMDVAIAVAGAGGGLASRLVVATGSYALLSVAGSMLSLALLPAIALPARQRVASRN
ncbi:hypothetical protein AB0M72_19865 [Nocardiopsis dassonvillei]